MKIKDSDKADKPAQQRNQRAREETLSSMRQINPIVIVRSHLVEEALVHRVERLDFSVMDELVAALRNPYTPHSRLSPAPVEDDSDYWTFCGK